MSPDALEEKDEIKHLFEENGKLYIAFHRHAAYYTVPLSNTELCAAIHNAQALG